MTVFSLWSWLRSSSRPALAEPALALPSATLPAFIKPVAKRGAGGQNPAHEQTAAGNQDRDPGRALGRLRGRAAGTGDRGRAGAWTPADEAESLPRGFEAFPKLDAVTFTNGTAFLEHRNGAEHDALFDPVSGRVIKLTQPGEFGAWGGLEEYLQRQLS